MHACMSGSNYQQLVDLNRTVQCLHTSWNWSQGIAFDKYVYMHTDIHIHDHIDIDMLMECEHYRKEHSQGSGDTAFGSPSLICSNQLD